MALSGALGPERAADVDPVRCQGKEVWRYVGDLDWTSPEAAKLLRKPAPPKKADQPAVDRGQPEGDQAEAEEVLRRQGLAKEQAAEQDRYRRHQQGHEQRVGRAGMFDQAEIEDVGEGPAEQGQGGDRRPRAERREGMGPRRSTVIATGSISSAPAVSWPVVTLSGDTPIRRNRRAHTAARA